jgi:prepilin-type processing-associated H-X9-DG protein
MCPSAFNDLCTHGSSTLGDGRKTYTSHYYGIMGPKGVDAEGNSYRMASIGQSYHGGFADEGLLRLNTPTSIRDIRDGTSSTLMLGEIVHDEITVGYSNSAVGGGDGSCWIRGVGFGTTRDAVSGMASAKNVLDGINVIPGDFNDNTFSSQHPGGAQFALADGSVTFVSESIDLLLYKALCSRAHGEVAAVP